MTYIPIVRRTRLALLIPVLWGLASAACSDDGPGPMSPDPDPDPAPTDTLAAVGWESLTNAPLRSAASRHDDVFFLDDANGWLINGAGEVHGTEDGGANWTPLHTEDGVFFRSVGFADESRGWIGNLNGFNQPTPSSALYETTDGGMTWTNITDRVTGPEPVGICGLWIADSSTIYGVGRWNGPAVFIRSTDGGDTWESESLEPMATGLVDVFFFDEARGLVIGGKGVGNSVAEQEASVTVILGTDDGGDTWDVRYESTTPGTWGWKFSFPTPQIGYAAVQGPSPRGTVLKTTDGGQTWVELTVAEPAGFSGIGFADADLGWVGADLDLAFETRDGGATWLPVRLGENLNRFRMLPSGIGYAAGRGVYRYTP